jgi:hypothetical protein
MRRARSTAVSTELPRRMLTTPLLCLVLRNRKAQALQMSSLSSPVRKYLHPEIQIYTLPQKFFHLSS